MRTTLTCWSVTPDPGMTPSQHFWTTIRLKDQAPLTPEERAQLRAPLLPWGLRRGEERLTAVVKRQQEEDAPCWLSLARHLPRGVPRRLYAGLWQQGLYHS